MIQSAKAETVDDPVRKNPFGPSPEALNKGQEQQTVPAELPPINGGPVEYKAMPVITNSARGWNLEVNTLRKSSPTKRWFDDTILISPNGQRLNVGERGVPDIHRPILWVVDVPALKARFLVLYLYPVASGGSQLSLFLIRENRIASTAAKISHHFEWGKEMTPRDVIRQLFKDIDGDGKPELVENAVGKSGGSIIYHEYVGATFFPTWIEEYRPNKDYKMRRVSLKSLKTKTK